MPRVLPSQLTDEEILTLLEAEEKLWDEDIAKIFDYNDDIVPFLSNYQITPGTTQVSKKLLYKLYKAYSKNPLDNLNFNVKAGTYLSHDRDHYLINIDQFAISKHIYETQKTKDKTKSLSFQKHFGWFVEESKVQQGKVWLEGFILFYIYKDFCRQRRVNPKLGYTNFHKFLKLHFQYKRIKGNRSLWFKVDEQTANIFSEEERERIREARQKTRRSKEESERESETSPS
jgi:hypothetical protein